MKNLHGTNETNLTGIWVKVDSQKQSGLNMLDLLDSNRAVLEEI